jgi:hypothetical protein
MSLVFGYQSRQEPGRSRAPNVPGEEGLPGGRRRGRGTLCGGLGYLCDSELEIRSHVGDLDLDGLTLVAVVVLPADLLVQGPIQPNAMNAESQVLMGIGPWGGGTDCPFRSHYWKRTSGSSAAI